jgi:hypothetical protein
MTNARTANPTGHQIMKPRIVSTIQAGLAEFVELCGDGHADPSRVNVNNIYIAN